MPQVSKRLLKPEVKQDLFDSLSYIVKELKTKNDVDSFLSSALTETERVMVAKRVLTAFLLSKGVEEKKIGDTLKLTPATITRLKMWIKLRQKGFYLVFAKLDKKLMENEAKKVFYKILNYSLKAAFGHVSKPF